jgi:LPS sulfotransferase NodH
MLCKLLAATGVAGRPASLFHEGSVDAWLAYFSLDPIAGETEAHTLKRVFRSAIDQGTDGTGIFGLRLQRHSFDFFMEKLAVLFPGRQSDCERLTAAFGQTLFIHLTRTDKIGQAVSYVRAQQSGLWHRAPDGTELERLSEPRGLAYDREVIGASFDAFTAYDRDWRDWFARFGMAPLEITYESLSADPQAALHRVLDSLGVDTRAAEGVVPGTAKLADAVSRDWAARFARDLAIRDDTSAAPAAVKDGLPPR